MTNNLNEIGFNNSNLTASFVPRARLDNIFGQEADRRIVYVVAGAGYGKTTAVHHYIEQQQDAVVFWMQLSDSDNVGSIYLGKFCAYYFCLKPKISRQNSGARLFRKPFPTLYPEESLSQTEWDGYAEMVQKEINRIANWARRQGLKPYAAAWDYLIPARTKVVPVSNTKTCNLTNTAIWYKNPIRAGNNPILWGS